MSKSKQRESRRRICFVTLFLLINILAMIILGQREIAAVKQNLSAHADNTQEKFENILADYERSFQLFSHTLSLKVQSNPDPDHIWDYLKGVDEQFLAIEGETFGGLYMYYKDRFLYSWDTPYEEYEATGYEATERPWYKAAAAKNGQLAFTPPYMSYAKHYMLTTISQMQPDGETVFAYDIKMGDIQTLVSTVKEFEHEQIMIYDDNGTVIGSTEADYLGGNLYGSLEDASKVVTDAQLELSGIARSDRDEVRTAEEKLQSATAFYDFRQTFDQGFEKLRSTEKQMVLTTIDGKKNFGFLLQENGYNFLIFVPVASILKDTTDIWLVPLLIVELLLIYVLARIGKEQRNRELKSAYVELGQTQKRLEIALSAAQKAAAIDDLTGMMNFKSFRKAMVDLLESMDEGERGILIMIDGDHFKNVNDNYGHNIGDEVIKLSAQMIVGRIRTVDLASRLHGDEFAIFVADTEDYDVAKGIVEDINRSLAKEAEKRTLPAITLSAGAVVAKRGDNYTNLSKEADTALYKAKETHNGAFSHIGEL